MSSPSKRVVIVGGASGIGETSCHVMAQAGWSVVVGDLDLHAASRVAAACGGAPLRIDVGDDASVEAAAEQIERELGPVDALVVTAAIFQEALSPEKLPMETWDRIVRINFRGTYITNVAFGKRMALRGKGSIVNTSSITGVRASPVHVYGPVKAAVNCMSENLAAEWGRSGVRVNVVSPGTIPVERVKARLASGARYAGRIEDHTVLGRLASVEEVAQTIEFLASDKSSGITGANIVVDAGMLLAPSWHMFGGVPGPR